MARTSPSHCLPHCVYKNMCILFIVVFLLGCETSVRTAPFSQKSTREGSRRITITKKFVSAILQAPARVRQYFFAVNMMIAVESVCRRYTGATSPIFGRDRL